MKKQYMKKGNPMPGQMVSADHYIYQDLRRLNHTKEKSAPYEMFLGWIFFTTPVVI